MMSPAKSDHVQKREDARAMARTCYHLAVEAAVQVLSDPKAKPAHRLAASDIIIRAAEWEKDA